MNKTNLVIIIGIILTITILGFVLYNHYNLEREYELKNTPEQLSWIFASCECEKRVKANPDTHEGCVQPLASWQNDTHYIDNNFCKFVQQPDVCTQPMMSFINHWSNMFENEEPLIWTFRGSDSIVESDQFEECRDELLKINKKS